MYHLKYQRVRLVNLISTSRFFNRSDKFNLKKNQPLQVPHQQLVRLRLISRPQEAPYLLLAQRPKIQEEVLSALETAVSRTLMTATVSTPALVEFLIFK